MVLCFGCKNKSKSSTQTSRVQPEAVGASTRRTYALPEHLVDVRSLQKSRDIDGPMKEEKPQSNPKWPTSKGEYIVPSECEPHLAFNHEDSAFWVRIRTLQSQARQGNKEIVRMALRSTVGWTPTAPPLLFHHDRTCDVLPEENETDLCVQSAPLLRFSTSDSPLSFVRDLNMSYYVQGYFEGEELTMIEWLYRSWKDMKIYRKGMMKVFRTRNKAKLSRILVKGTHPVFVVQDWCVEYDKVALLEDEQLLGEAKVEELKRRLDSLEKKKRTCSSRVVSDL